MAQMDDLTLCFNCSEPNTHWNEMLKEYLCATCDGECNICGKYMFGDKNDIALSQRMICEECLCREEGCQETKAEFKLLTAEYKQIEYYKIPKEWELKDISIKWGVLYYKGKEVAVPQGKFEHDMKRPDELEIDDSADLDLYFDCEDEDDA